MIEMRDFGPLYVLLLESSDLLVLVYGCKFCRLSANLEFPIWSYTYGRPL
jgi:hypothetical protein